MKNKKNLLVLIIAILVIAVAVILLVKPNVDEKAKITEYAHITDVLAKYNEKNEDPMTDVSLMESDTELAFMINGLVETEDNLKQHIFVSYTNMRISSVVYDKNSQPLQIVNMYINEEYNVIKVDLYDYTTDKAISYKANDPKIDEFQKRANLMSDKIKEIFNAETLNGVTLFNKTINDVKETKINK